ncbi:MAG: tetratricopeptide repeat protein, partial [Pseudomonadales bacterium]
MNNIDPINSPISAFSLGQYRIDPGANQIRGLQASVQVEPKAMAVLCVLASRAGETISREELLAAVWPGRVVVEETLTRAIGQLRAALSDNASKPSFIQTVPKQGYRLIASLETEPSQRERGRATATNPAAQANPDREPGGPARRYFLMGAGGLLLALLLMFWFSGPPPARAPSADAGPAVSGGATAVAQPSIAVLPFRNLSADAESEYFAEGIAEELLNALAGVSGLRVPSRRSSFAFKAQSADLNTIASQLKVRHLLEGSVRRAGDTLRISAQLIDVKTDTTVWSQQYDRQLQGIFAVQEEIARQVISALKGTLLGTTATRIARTKNMDAYSLYLQGQYWWMNGSSSNWFYQARDAFKRAIELDPEFADAYAGLAYIYARFNFYDEYMPATQAWPLAEQALKKALQLNPAAVDALFARAILASSKGDFAGAKVDLDRALALSPSSSTGHFLYSEVWLSENRPQQAVAAATRALDLDPLSPWVHVNMAIVLFSVGQWDEALGLVQRALEIDPQYTWAYIWRAHIEHARGNLAEAIAAMHKCVTIDPASESNSAYL